MKTMNLNKPDVTGLDRAQENASEVFARLREMNDRLSEKFGQREDPLTTAPEETHVADGGSGPKGAGKSAGSHKTAPTDLYLSDQFIAEDAKPGVKVGSLLVEDQDRNENFTFQLLDTADGKFVLSGADVFLAQGQSLDFETASSFEIRVRVTDKFGLSYTETLSIKVQDVAVEETVVVEAAYEEPASKDPVIENPVVAEPVVAEPVAEVLSNNNPTPVEIEVPDYVLEALIPGDIEDPHNRWNSDQSVGSSVTVTYAFADSLPDAYASRSLPYATNGAEFESFNATQKTAVREIFAAVEEYANITFVETNDANASDISFGSYLMTSDAGGYAYYPGAGSVSGDVWITTRWDTKPDLNADTAGDWARFILSHEIGHSLGLEHSHTGGLPDAEDGTAHSVMSYHYDHGGRFSMDFQIFDIAALQHLYGANTDHNTGDDVYDFDPTNRAIDSIWDAGGHDTLSAESAEVRVIIDLRESAFSKIGLANSVSIAFGTEIEDAVGGSANDKLTGNDGDNRLDGGLGDDIMIGLLGSDTFVIAGNDTIKDFEDGVDQIQWDGIAFDQLDISEVNGQAVVSDGANSLTLQRVSADQVDANDFAGAFV